MVERPITEQQDRDGRALYETLQRRGWDIEAAFWAYRPSIREWRLVFVTKRLDIKGDRGLIKELKRTIQGFGTDFSVRSIDIDLESPYDPFMMALGRAFRITDSTDIRVSAAHLFGAYFADLWIYEIDIRSPFQPTQIDNNDDAFEAVNQNENAG